MYITIGTGCEKEEVDRGLVCLEETNSFHLIWIKAYKLGETRNTEMKCWVRFWKTVHQLDRY